MQRTNEERWCELWSRVAPRKDVKTLHSELVARYGEPHRAYHTLKHIDSCLRLFDEVRGMASEPDAVELAIWFHDVVYDPKSKLNEEKSSKFWSVYAAGYGVPEAMVQKVAKLILATKHEAVAPVSPDAALLVDIDLAILGQPADVFERYEAQVREEYNWVPDREFAEGRSAVMKMFLDREFIYFTPDLRHRYEVQARTNLAKSIACWDMVSHIIQSSLAARSL